MLINRVDNHIFLVSYISDMFLANLLPSIQLPIYFTTLRTGLQFIFQR